MYVRDYFCNMFSGMLVECEFIYVNIQIWKVDGYFKLPLLSISEGSMDEKLPSKTYKPLFQMVSFNVLPQLGSWTLFSLSALRVLPHLESPSSNRWFVDRRFQQCT
jgi:hypothetical protein